MRWAWIDEFISIEKEKRSEAKRHFGVSEDCFEGHFPGCRVVPNPLLIEAMAQTGGILVGAGFDFKKEVVLAKVPRAKFHKVMQPPVELHFEAELKEKREGIAFVNACVKNKGEVVGEADIVFACIDKLLPDSDEKVVFTPQFLQALRVREIAK